jgi:hypothetical protein
MVEYRVYTVNSRPKRSVHVFTFPYLREHADAQRAFSDFEFRRHNSVDASRRCADDPTTLLNLIARRLGQGLIVVHRAAVAHVEAAFRRAKLNRPEQPFISVEKVSSNTAL